MTVINKLFNTKANEVKATLLSFLFIFIIMAAYYILRPVRDAMASDWSDTEVSQLWSLNFFISTAAVAIYGFVVARLKFKYLVPTIYLFFASTFILFYFGSSVVADQTLVNKSFYVWLSVFAMFHLSVFWSFMSDLYNKEQAKRLFASIAAGASAGALIGPALPTLFAGMIGTYELMLIASVMLLIPVPLTFMLSRLKVTVLGNQDHSTNIDELKIGGNPLAGFKSFATDPYLLAVGGFILLYTMVGSFVYFEQKNLLAEFDRTTRTQILGGIDWIVNVLTFVIAFFATGRIVQKKGMPFTLALLPVLVGIGILILAFAPIITVLLILQVARRAGNYALTRPAREMLFTEVTKETRFKAKPVIDVVIYRGGDTVTAWFFTGLTEGLGLAFTAVGIIGAGIATLWGVVGIYIGRLYEKRTEW